MKFGRNEASTPYKKINIYSENKEGFIKENELLFSEINRESFDNTIKNEIVKKAWNNEFKKNNLSIKDFFIKYELENSKDRINNDINKISNIIRNRSKLISKSLLKYVN